MDQTVDRQTKELLRVAVASYEGVLVNKHLGMAETLLIFDTDQKGSRMVERRRTPEKGCGEDRWNKLASLLGDCSAVLANSVGETPLDILSAHGIKVYEVEGLIEDALTAIYQGKELRMPYRRRANCRRSESGGSGQGCG